MISPERILSFEGLVLTLVFGFLVVVGLGLVVVVGLVGGGFVVVTVGFLMPLAILCTASPFGMTM